MQNNATYGFTLIELSIVLVIIGFVVGGVLVGQELIETAKLRAVVSQIDQIRVGANTFRTKYNALPSVADERTHGPLTTVVDAPPAIGILLIASKPLE